MEESTVRVSPCRGRRKPIALRPSNREIADILEQIGLLLESQGANPHRVRAYRVAAGQIRDTEKPVARLVVEKGAEYLERLPGIGRALAGTIKEIVRSGSSGMLERLQGEMPPVRLFSSIPGIGPRMAEQIVDELDLHSLEELEVAAHDGRLQSLRGFGPKRVRSVRDTLQTMLDRSVRYRTQRGRLKPAEEGPSVSLLLEMDARYRKLAEEDRLKKIAPRRFNPEQKAWLPIMHQEAEGWSFTLLFSNTHRAHELGKTHDWVVIYFSGREEEGQHTVVTAGSGPLKGKRIVRGREQECLEHYRG
jgi:hypothetical protein